MIRLILVVILLTLSVTFFLQNRREEAVLHYFGATTEPTPIYKPILSAFGAGLLIMGILLFPAWIKLRMQLRRSRKALQQAEEELESLRNPEALLFFRVGDFYEMFYEDAIEGSRLLEIALTSRDKSKVDQVPLCGVPYHAANAYIAKLLKAGRSVALCEQLEDPKLA